MTPLAPADRLIFPARCSQQSAVKWSVEEWEQCLASASPSYTMLRRVLWQLLLDYVLSVGVPASLLRGTCAGQKNGGTVAGRSWVQSSVM
jgi:hypothetical protein